jgi:hypothetical protein
MTDRTHGAPVLACAAFAALALTGGGCSQKTCPTIACVPRISLSYSNAVPDPYRLSVQVNGTSVVENCPATRSDLGLTPGIASCDGSHAVVTGVDLGHGDNGFIAFSVSFGGPVFLTNASLLGITNSRDCDLVCYEHAGEVQNTR